MMEHDTTEQLVVACYTGNLGKETLPLGALKQSFSRPLDLRYTYPRKEHESNIKTITMPVANKILLHGFGLAAV